MRPLTLKECLLLGFAVAGIVAVNRWIEPSPVPESAALDKLSLTGPELVYFYGVDCDSCRATAPLVDRLAEETPELKVVRLDQNLPENQELRAIFNKLYEVPEDRQFLVPSAFLGKQAFLGRRPIERRLPEAVAAWAESPLKPHLLVTEPNPAEAREQILGQFRRFRALPIIAAAFLDGINPCAISTMVFLLSFLLWAQRRDIVWVGLTFSAGVFVAYTLSGLGLFHGLKALSGFAFVASGLWVLMAGLLLAFGLASLGDWRRAREGRTGELELQLPVMLKRRIHALIRRDVRLRPAGLGAFFLLGAAVSLLEFICTGQVYLPTLMYVLSVPEYAARAFGWLLIYNLCFTLPLLLLTVVAAAGAGSDTISDWFARRLATSKLLLGLLMLGFGVYFLTQIR